MKELMSEEESIKILEDFKNNELEPDKLEINLSGGFKIGDIYKFTELNPAIETILYLYKNQKKEIRKYKRAFARSLRNNSINKETIKQDLKELDLIIEEIKSQYKETYALTDNYKKAIFIKEYLNELLEE